MSHLAGQGLRRLLLPSSFTWRVCPLVLQGGLSCSTVTIFAGSLTMIHSFVFSRPAPWLTIPTLVGIPYPVHVLFPVNDSEKTWELRSPHPITLTYGLELSSILCLSPFFLPHNPTPLREWLMSAFSLSPSVFSSALQCSCCPRGSNKELS